MWVLWHGWHSHEGGAIARRCDTRKGRRQANPGLVSLDRHDTVIKQIAGSDIVFFSCDIQPTCMLADGLGKESALSNTTRFARTPVRCKSSRELVCTPPEMNPERDLEGPGSCTYLDLESIDQKLVTLGCGERSACRG